MELIRGQHNLRARHQGCVLTIGNFDGVHLGHQAILAQVVAKARALGVKSCVMIFEPQPAEFFARAKAPARLMPLRDKLMAMAAAGVDQVLCLRFDKRLAALTAAAFVDELLVAGLGTRFLVVGDDFRFGAGRAGDVAFLRQAGQTSGFAVTDTHTVAVDGERVSSTRVRAALEAQDFTQVARLCGRPYCISGRVRYGDQLGRTIDCPTANLALSMVKAPLAGIYVVRVSSQQLDGWPGVASCGTRPTVNGTDNRLEVHLLDFSGDLYRQHLRVELLQFVRPELKFDGLAELKAAIANDVLQAREFFQQRLLQHQSAPPLS